MERVKRLSKNIGIRHRQTLLLFSGYMIAYIIRNAMSVGIVAMTDKDSKNLNITIFDWNSRQQNLILSSILWGIITTQVPISFFVQNMGRSHKALYYGALVSGLVMVITPFLACKLGWIAVLVTRIIIGISQGTLQSCMKIQIFNWIPFTERAQLGSFILNGPLVGNIFTMFFSGLLAASSFGWPSIFYTYGAMGIVWSLLYWWLGAESPAHHKYISLTEKMFIENNAGQEPEKNKPPFPWKEVLKSLPVWALLITGVCNLWTNYTLTSEMPLFMKSVLKYNIDQSGMFSALPFLANWLFTFPISWASDFALAKGFQVTIIRKICNTIGMWGPGLMLLMQCFINSSEKSVPITLMVLAVGLHAGTICGQGLNELDIAPNFVGILSSIINTIAKLFGILAPIVFGIIVTDPENVSQWHIVFYISVATCFLGNLVFIVFGKAEIQPWNREILKIPCDDNIAS